MLAKIYAKIKQFTKKQTPLISENAKVEEYLRWEEGFLAPFLNPSPNNCHQSQKLSQVTIYIDFGTLSKKLCQFGREPDAFLDGKIEKRKDITLWNLCQAFHELDLQLKVEYEDIRRFRFEKPKLDQYWAFCLTTSMFNNERLRQDYHEPLKEAYLCALKTFLDFESFCFSFQLTIQNWPVRRLITLAKLIIIYNAHLIFDSLPLSKPPGLNVDGTGNCIACRL